jgi:hypothetical protein
LSWQTFRASYDSFGQRGITPIDLRRHFANSGIERERCRVRAASALVILFIAGAIIGVVWLRWG